MLKKTGLTLVILAALATTAAFVYGQDSGHALATKDRQTGSHPADATVQSAERIASVLAENQQALGLTDAQVDRLAQALAAAQAPTYRDHDQGDYQRRSYRRHSHGDGWCYRDHSDRRHYDGWWCCH